MSKKVLLINPNYLKVYKYLMSSDTTMVEAPIGLAYIAGMLRHHDIDVQILDLAGLQMDDPEAIAEVKRRKPDIVGLGAATNTLLEAFNIAKFVKEVDPSILVVLGGPHTSVYPARTLDECPYVDIVVMQEAEHTFLEISQGKALKDVLGIAYRSKGATKVNKPRPLLNDLDSLPFPARDLLPMHKYWSPGISRPPGTTLLTSRGCPSECTFCVDHEIHGRAWRYRSAENVIAEIDHLVHDFGIREIDIVDDNFTLIQKRAMKICDYLIERKYDLVLKTGNGIRADRLSEPLVKKMAQAGFYLLAFGIESGNDEVLKTILKGESKVEIENAIHLCKKYGIKTEGFFMIGNEGENEKTMQETIDYAIKLDLDIAQFQIFTPLPGSEYAKKIAKEGKMYVNTWADYNAYGKAIFEHGELTKELMERMQKKAYRDYYMRPKMFVRQMKSIKNWKDLKANMGAALAVLK